MAGDRKSGRIEPEASCILARVAETLDIILTERQTPLSTGDVDVGIDTLWRFLNRRQISFRTAHAAEQDRADVAAAREPWFAGQIDVDPEKLVLIDETGATP